MLTYSSESIGFSLPCPGCGKTIHTAQYACPNCKFAIGYAKPKLSFIRLPSRSDYSSDSPGFPLPCPQCAEPIHTAMPRCPACGYGIGYLTPTVTVPQTQGKKPWWKRLLKIVGLTYFVLVVVIVFLGKAFSKESWPRLNHAMTWLLTPVILVFGALFVGYLTVEFWTIGVRLLETALKAMFPRSGWTEGKGISRAVAAYGVVFLLAGLAVWRNFYFGWGGVSGVPHGEVFGPAILAGMLWLGQH
jgi:hypothetical protein